MLAKPHFESSWTDSGGHDAGRSSKPVKTTQSSVSDNTPQPGTVPPALEPSQRYSKKQRKYARKYKAQLDGKLKKLCDAEQDLSTCLKRCTQIQSKVNRRHAIWRSLIYSPAFGFRKLREAFAAASDQNKVLYFQLTTLRLGMLVLLLKHPWDEWGRGIKAIGEDTTGMTRAVMTSGFFDDPRKPPREVRSILAKYHLLAFYISAMGQLLKALGTLIQVMSEVSELIDRKRFLYSVLMNIKPDLGKETLEASVDSNAQGEMFTAVWKFLAPFEQTVGMKRNLSGYFNFFDQYPEAAELGGKLMNLKEGRSGKEVIEGGANVELEIVKSWIEEEARKGSSAVIAKTAGASASTEEEAIDTPPSEGEADS